MQNSKLNIEDEIIKTVNVTKIFNKGMPDEVRAINNVSVEINRGEVVVLKGPSGLGKTTLLSLIGCMTRPTEGRVIVNGKDVAKLPERFLTEMRRKTFGFVFQQLNLIRDISVIENIMLPLYPTDIKLSAIQKKAEFILERMGIFRKKSHKVRELSGGEQQRAAIARALINKSEAILADEPTAHLDTALSGDMLSILRQLNKDGKTVIIATHDTFIYESSYVDKMIEMRDGMIKSAQGY